MRERAELVARGLSAADRVAEPGAKKLMETRENVQRAWQEVSEILIREKQPELAARVQRFVRQMPPAMTERRWLAEKLAKRTRPPRTPEGPEPKLR